MVSETDIKSFERKITALHVFRIELRDEERLVVVSPDKYFAVS